LEVNGGLLGAGLTSVAWHVAVLVEQQCPAVAHEQGMAGKHWIGYDQRRSLHQKLGDLP
jgi:hypothetical protein